MEDKKQPAPSQVAAAFVEQYYVILSKSPENLHRFYQEPSLLGWPKADGVVNSVTTLTEINKKIMSNNYKDCSVEINSTDSQESKDGGIMIVVTGCLTGKDTLKKNFCQTFFLAKQEKGFFVLNDILRIFYVCESKTDVTCSSTDEETDRSSPTNDSVLASRAAPFLNFKAAIQNGKVEASEHMCSVSEKNLANGPTSTPSIPSGEEVVLAAPAASNLKAPSIVTPPSSAASKITYASVVAKQTKASSPRGEVSITVSNPTGGVSKAPASPRKVTPKSPITTGAQGQTTSSAYHTEAKGIYIGGLPYGISKQGIVDVVKQFGVVRRYLDDVQIRRHEDGFCCGFVEFESADSARRAVEAHLVMFGDKEAYITYKRQFNTRGSNIRPRSPKTALRQSGSPRGRENEDWTYYSKGQARGALRSSSSDQWPRQAS